MSCLASAIILLTAAAGSPGDTPVQEQEAVAKAALYNWELDLFAGYGQLAWPALDTTNTHWSNGNVALALSVAYRSPHFTHPFVDISYVPFISSGYDVYVPNTNGSVYARSSSHALGIIFGPGFDISWFRVRGGVGLYAVTTSTTVQDVNKSTTSANIGYLVTASALVWQRDQFAVGIEGRFMMLQSPGNGVFQSSWAAGLTGRWDFARH
jgi:hypothetical protein